MAKPRSPDIDLAEVTGSKQKNPSRFKTPVGGIHSPALGQPSRGMRDDEKVYWEAFKRELPHLTEADRAVTELACYMRAKKQRGELSLHCLGHYRSLLKEMGATPVSRGRVKLMPNGKKPEADHSFS